MPELGGIEEEDCVVKWGGVDSRVVEVEYFVVDAVVIGSLDVNGSVVEDEE